MSLCLLRTASLIHERIAYTTLSPARLIHQYRKRQFENQTLKRNVPSVLICNMSTDVPDDKKLSYEELLDLIKKKEVTLIDVRSRVEVKSTGLLPKSFHIPVNEYVTAMKVPDKIFKKKYGFDKPRPEDPIVFVCSTGARSYKALRAALHMGYNNARMFDGNFSDLAKQITDT
ncbi:rhodanese domain-containing protein CG4456-like isoform X1 [Schistocerca serialis cubense]|uniref:rhodanese domain-containing protein CG4456-like isoform X1 n=1 Tax=Schistocerca serialis cubense TaxID=2023355 RepID=UPI00214F1EC6|nr:rhodanese domain-containing protein CG4456-like isoform X1 [Schistocerca serialis cubense]